MSLGMPGFDVAVECYVGVVFIHYSRDPLHHTRSIPTADVGWACVNPGVMSSVSDWRLPRGIPSVGSERRGGGGVDDETQWEVCYKRCFLYLSVVDLCFLIVSITKIQYFVAFCHSLLLSHDT